MLLFYLLLLLLLFFFPGQRASADLPGPICHSRSPDGTPTKDGRHRRQAGTFPTSPRSHSGINLIEGSKVE